MARSVLLAGQKTTIATAPIWADAPGLGHTTQPYQLFTAEVSGIGSCSATVVLVGSNDSLASGTPVPQTIATLTPSGTSADITPGTAFYAGTAPWKRFGATVTGISGTNAAVTVVMNS